MCVRVRLPLVISGISREAQVPRAERLEGAPLHAQANRSPTKARPAAPGAPLEPCRFLGLVCAFVCVCRGMARSLLITHSCAGTCLSVSARYAEDARPSGRETPSGGPLVGIAPGMIRRQSRLRWRSAIKAGRFARTPPWAKKTAGPARPSEALAAALQRVPLLPRPPALSPLLRRESCCHS